MRGPQGRNLCLRDKMKEELANYKTKFSKFTPSLFPIKFNKKVLLVLVLGLCIISGMLLMSTNNGYKLLLVDNHALAVVKGEDQVEGVIQKLKDDLPDEMSSQIVGCLTQLSYDNSSEGAGEPVTDEDLYALLKDKLNWTVDCWTLKINNKPTLYLASREDAQKALDEIKLYYIPKKEDLSIESTKIIDDIDIAEAEGPLLGIKTPEEAVVALAKGLDKIVKHKVNKGDSLWTIAKANDMTVSQLREINPQLKGDLLRPGQELNLVKSEPLLTVVTTITTTQEERIKYSTIYEEDSTLWRGQYKVKQYGSNGSREVTYRITKTNDEETNRETLVEKILMKPVTQIVKQGTKVLMASRGDGGSGRLGWPLRGRLTSYYGWRHREFHTGLDIDGDTGDSIYAAESGEVIFTGWMGNYGNLIVIDHGNGLSTRYGHLHKILVKVGQKVSRGDVIGRCGSTGRSTGSHLHFEVRINGQHKNPLNYLER